MKKLIISLFGAIFLTGCGVGTYSVSSGRADIAEISFISSDNQQISVVIDGQTYNVEAVKDKAYKTDRNIKKTAKNTIKVQPGRHDVKVFISGNEVFSNTVFVSASEKRIVEL